MKRTNFLRALNINLQKAKNIYEIFLQKYINKIIYTLLISIIYFFVIITSTNFYSGTYLNIISKTLLLIFCPIFGLMLKIISPNLIDITDISFLLYINLLLISTIVISFIIKKVNKILPSTNKTTISENKDILMFIHDLKNLMLPALGYAEMNNLEKTKYKLYEICIKLNKINVPSDTLSTIFLIENIINIKRPIMKNFKIDLNYKIGKISKINMEDEDLCSLIGNIIDNAIESCNKIPEPTDRFINFEIFEDKNSLIIAVENSKLPDKNNNFDPIKSTKLLSGYGLKSINQISEKYNGKATFLSEDKIFFTEVTIPLT